MKKSRFFSAKNIAYLAVLLALVIVLQIWAGGVKIGPTSVSFVLIPIVLGAILLGPAAGAFLGCAFGVVVIIMGVMGADYFTFVVFSDHPVLTVLLCLVKGAAAGFVAGILFKLLRGKNESVAVLVSALAAPVVNTGLFILGALLMSDTLSANFVADGQTVLYFLVIVCAGLNFVVEFIINAVASPVIYTVARVVGKKVEGRFFRKGASPEPEQNAQPVSCKERVK